MSSSSSSCQSGALVPYDAGGPPESSPFPAGLRVLLVDDDGVCLRVIAQMLKFFQYQVTTCNRAVDALETLRRRDQEFDLILSDLHMPDMDGFKLLEQVGLEMDLPVIMMSADEGTNVVMKGIKHGACDYLIKPVSMEALKNIWQHVVRKKRSNELKESENSESVEDGDKQKKRLEETDYTSSNEGNWKNLKRRKDGKEEEVEEERDDSSATKKQRVVWSMELHKQFVEAVKNLGVEKAVPKKILEMMNVPGLTRENVASHLQKYRLYLRRVHSLQNPNRVDTRFSSGTSEAQAYSSMSSLDQYSLQCLAASGHMPPQSVLSVPSGSSRVTNMNIDMPIAGQKAFFDTDVHSSKRRSSVGQPVTNRHMGLNGLPSYVEPGQFGIEQRQQGFLPPPLNASSSFSHGAINGNLNNSSVMQIPQCGQHISLSHQQPRGYLVNANVREHDPGEQILSSGVLTQFWGGNGTTASGESSPQGNYMNNPYDTSQVFYAANYQSNCGNGSVGNSHPFVSSTGASNIKPTNPFVSSTGASNIKPTSMIQAATSTNYDIVGDLHQSQEWKLQNVNLSYGSPQLLGPKQNHIDVGSSISTPQDFNAILKDGTGRNTCTFVKKVYSITAEIEPQKVVCVPQHNGAVRVENPCRLKEVAPDPIFQNEFDLMDVVGFQQEVGFGEDEHVLDSICPFEA